MAALAAIGASGDWRRAMGPREARGIEALIDAFYPGASVRQAGALALQVEASPGEWKTVIISSPVVIQNFGQGTEDLVYGSVEIAEEADRAEPLLKKGENVPRGTAPMRIAVLILGADGHVVESRKALVDAEASVAENNGLEIEDWPDDKRWPVLEIRYGGFYYSNGMVAGISWTGKLDSDTMTLKERYPMMAWFRLRDGREKVEHYSARKSGAAVAISARGGRRIQFQCPSPSDCVVPVSAMLAGLASATP